MEINLMLNKEEMQAVEEMGGVERVVIGALLDYFRDKRDRENYYKTYARLSAVSILKSNGGEA